MLSGNSNLGIRIICDLSEVFSLRTKIKKNSVSKCVTWDSTPWLNHDHVMCVNQQLMPFKDIAGFPWKRWTWLFKIEGALSKGLGDGAWMISITSTKQNTCRSFSSAESQASKRLLGQEAANRCDMKFLLESMTLLGILLVFSTYKTWNSH